MEAEFANTLLSPPYKHRTNMEQVVYKHYYVAFSLFRAILTHRFSFLNIFYCCKTAFYYIVIYYLFLHKRSYGCYQIYLQSYILLQQNHSVYQLFDKGTFHPKI